MECHGRVELLDPAHDGIERAIEHQAGDEPSGILSSCAGLAVAKVERHRGVSVAFPVEHDPKSLPREGWGGYGFSEKIMLRFSLRIIAGAPI